MTRAATYCRVSTSAQDGEDKVSLDEQISDMEAYCQRRGLTIVARYQDIASGVLRDRPGFVALQDGARGGAFDVVLAWKADRLARSGSGMGDLLDSVEPRRVSIETVVEHFDQRYAELMASIGRMERRNIVERSLMGKRGAAKLGKIPAGRPLYGYDKDDDGKPVINEAEALVVSRLFRMYADDRQGVPTIAKTLDSEYDFKRTAAGLYWMLRNETYAGKMVYDGVEIPCPPIISKALWDKAQACLSKNLVRGAKGNTKVNYLLQQTVHCDGCGRLLSARTRREKNGNLLRYYRCRGYTRECRPRPYIRADELETQVWHHIRGVLARPDLVVERFSSDTNFDALAEDIRVAEGDLRKWTQRNERLTAIFVQGIIDQDEFEHQRRFVQEPLEAAPRSAMPASMPRRSGLMPLQTSWKHSGPTRGSTLRTSA